MQQNQTTSSFDLDEIVWARVTGYPFWPGQVSCIYEKLNPHGQKFYEYVVNFFNDVSHAILKEKCILKYVQHYEECSSSKYKGLKIAIMQADQALKVQKRDLSIKKQQTKIGPISVDPLNAEPLKQDDIFLSVILNCLTYQPNDIQYLWPTLDEIVQKLEGDRVLTILNDKCKKEFKCILRLLKNIEKQLKKECSSLQVSNMILRMEKAIRQNQNNGQNQFQGSLVTGDYQNHHCYQETQSEEQRIKQEVQSSSTRKESNQGLVAMCEETEEEPVLKQITFNEESLNESNGGLHIKPNHKSAFTPINLLNFNWERLNPLKHPKQIVEQKPAIQMVKYFQPIVLKPIQ